VDNSAEANRGFRPLNHAADKSIEAWAENLAGLFRAAAEGMFSESVDCAGIPAEQEWAVEVQADTIEELLHAWLSELLWVAERDSAAICRVEVDSVQDIPWRARGRAQGGPVPQEAPHTGAPVKAVTYHDLRIWREGQLWRAHLVFDV
jgi:SHS2 domain-containing protein